MKKELSPCSQGAYMLLRGQKEKGRKEGGREEGGREGGRKEGSSFLC